MSPTPHVCASCPTEIRTEHEHCCQCRLNMADSLRVLAGPDNHPGNPNAVINSEMVVTKLSPSLAERWELGWTMLEMKGDL